MFAEIACLGIGCSGLYGVHPMLGWVVFELCTARVARLVLYAHTICAVRAA